jgi:hypothetical protein
MKKCIIKNFLRFFAKNYSVDDINDDEMDGVMSCEGKVKYVYRVWWVHQKERNYFRNTGLDLRTALR